jgi:hypothetical protein
MPANKTGADLFSGTAELRELFEIVGMVVTNFGGIEDTMRYLHWQLKAFAIADPLLLASVPANDVQRKLGAERTIYFARTVLFKPTIDGIDKAFQAPSVDAALGTDKQPILAEWQELSTRALDLAKRRNELAHSVLAISGLSPVRRKGLLTNAQPVDTKVDRELTHAIGNFYGDIGKFINKLTDRLPFRDDNQVVFAS